MLRCPGLEHFGTLGSYGHIDNQHLIERIVYVYTLFHSIFRVNINSEHRESSCVECGISGMVLEKSAQWKLCATSRRPFLSLCPSISYFSSRSRPDPIFQTRPSTLNGTAGQNSSWTCLCTYSMTRRCQMEENP